MNDTEFRNGMIQGLKMAQLIIDEAATDYELEFTINGAIHALEMISSIEVNKSE